VGTYTEEIRVAAPPRIAYAYRLDFSNLPAYNPKVADLRQTAGGVGVGAEYEFRIRIAGLYRAPVRLRVVEAKEPSLIVVEIDALFDAVERCRFEPDGAGTRLTFTTAVETKGGPLAPLVDRLFVLPSGRSQVRSELERMRRALESRHAASSPATIEGARLDQNQGGTR
jgi:hypothetical protein